MEKSGSRLLLTNRVFSRLPLDLPTALITGSDLGSHYL